MKSTAEDIKDILIAFLGDNSSDSSSLAEDFELFEISVGKEPELPPNMITVIETPGFPDQLTFDRTERYEYPSVQIRVRANHYREGWEQISKIKELLHGRAQLIWGNSFYSVIRCVNGPFLFDYDKNQRPRFIINFNIQRRLL